MNKVIKIWLSVVIVYLSALVAPLKGHDEEILTKLVVVQNSTVENTIIQVDNIVDLPENSVITVNLIENMNLEMAEIESISDQQEWFIAYKDIIEKYAYIIDPPETIYDYFSEEELDLLFRVVQAEVGDEYSFEQKVNVAEVIFNRLEDKRFHNTLVEILTSDQFQTVANENYKHVKVSENTILACEYAFQIGTGREKCLFFDSNNTLNYEFVYNDAAHNFYKYRED